MQNKISIRFFNDREVRAVWNDKNAKWWFSVLDVVAVLTNQDDYLKTRNYWKYLKAKLKKENIELVSATAQLKLVAKDGKKYLTDVLDLILKKQLNKCVDWSKIAKNDYLTAMIKSVLNSEPLKIIIENSLTDEIYSREMFMKGIDYSYYYEEN